MLKKISHSSKSIKEFKKFQKEIDSIQDEAAKKIGHELLKKLKLQSSSIDNLHSPLAAKDIDAEKIKEHVDALVKIRLKIVKLLKDSKS